MKISLNWICGSLAGLILVLSANNLTPPQSAVATNDTPQLEQSSRSITSDAIQHPNVRAFLDAITLGEGTSGANGYRTIVGGTTFSEFSHHPFVNPRNGKVDRKTRKPFYFTNPATGKRDFSTAAGRYQFIDETWIEVARVLGLKDFSPESQDLGAVYLIQQAGALEDVKAGRIYTAGRKVSPIWASAPWSESWQRKVSKTDFKNYYIKSGGKVSE